MNMYKCEILLKNISSYILSLEISWRDVMAFAVELMWHTSNIFELEDAKQW